MANTVLYDPNIGYYYRENASGPGPGVYSEKYRNPNPQGAGGYAFNRTYYRNVPISGPTQQAATPTAPAVNFNDLPNQTTTGLNIYGAGNQAQAYQRPTTPTAPTQGAGYRPQFDMGFVQQMLAQRFGNNQGSGLPTMAGPPTHTPGANQSYGGLQGQGGLAALRALGTQNPTGQPAAPVGGTPIAP